MKNPAFTVNASEALKRMTLTVHVRRDLRFRVAFALIRLASFVSGFRVREA